MVEAFQLDKYKPDSILTVSLIAWVDFHHHELHD